MNKKGQEFGAGFFIGMICAFIIMVVIIRSVTERTDGTETLGTAICDQEYNMSYDRYYQGELFCEANPPAQEQKYDGLKIIYDRVD